MTIYPALLSLIVEVRQVKRSLMIIIKTILTNFSLLNIQILIINFMIKKSEELK